MPDICLLSNPWEQQRLDELRLLRADEEMIPTVRPAIAGSRTMRSTSPTMASASAKFRFDLSLSFLWNVNIDEGRRQALEAFDKRTGTI